MQFRRPDPMTPERGILQQDSTQIAVLYVGINLVYCMASADDKALTGQQIRIRVKMIIHSEYVLGTEKMIILQTFFTDGYDFTFVTGGSAALGKPVDGCVP